MLNKILKICWCSISFLKHCDLSDIELNLIKLVINYSCGQSYGPLGCTFGSFANLREVVELNRESLHIVFHFF